MRIGSLALFIILTLGGQATASENANEWRRDLDDLASELRKVHPRFRDCGLPPSLEEQMRNLAARADVLTDAEIVVGVQRLLASVGDGHMLLWPFGMKRGALLRLPLMLWWFDEGIYVIDASDRQLIGKRLVRIGGLPIQDVMKRLEPYVSHDNEMQLKWAVPFYATLTDFLAAAGAATDRNSAILEFEGAQARTIGAVAIDPNEIEEKLIPPKTADAPAYLRDRHMPFSTRQLASGVLYVRLTAMADSKERTLSEFGRALRPLLKRAAAAIVDIRLNNGGDATRADELLRSLIAFDTRGGKLAVLISRMTFSAAETFAARLDQWTGAVFVGEATGSKPNHYGNEQPFRLPNSGLRGSISSGFNQPVSGRDERTSIEPEVAVPMRAADYFAGSDPALDAAIRRLRRP
jgi:hypothetical protein